MPFKITKNKDGSYKGTVYRGISLLSEENYNKLIESDEIQFNAHSSASKSENTALSFAHPGYPKDKNTNNLISY